MKNTVHSPMGLPNALKKLSERPARPERPAKVQLQRPKNQGYTQPKQGKY